tara:strand:- start:41993 stop:42388 length:396 start_codon:yes stop_codon:yes gene_type:complete
MKNQFAALFFYMLYVIAMMRPLMPLLEYYSNYEYIATVLCENRDKPALACNGKCYLQKEMVNVTQPVSDQNHHHKSSTPLIDFSKYPVCPIVIDTYSIVGFSILLQDNWKLFCGSPMTYTSSVFRPPIFIV